MFEPFWLFVYAMGALLAVFILTRVISVAYFRSKREFLRDLWNDANKGDD